MITKAHNMENNCQKIEVLNPIEYFNPVGQEIIDVIKENNIDPELLECIDLNGLETKLAKSKIKEITNKIGKPELFEYFISFQNDYKQNKINSDNQYKSLKKIYSKIKHLEVLLNNEFIEGIDKLEDILQFLEIEDEENIFKEVEKNIALYRISNFIPDNLNLYSWLKRGELEYKKSNIEEYNKTALLDWIESYEWKSNLNNVDYLLNLPTIFEKYGVCLVFIPYLEKTVFGCVRWFDNKPVIQISDKGKCLATTWYTLFHEIGHVICHENDEVFEGNYDLPKNQITKKEREANDFAFKYLFNGDSVRRYIFKHAKKTVDSDFIVNTSKEFNVPVNFVAYWTKKAQIRGVSYGNYLKQITFSHNYR